MFNAAAIDVSIRSGERRVLGSQGILVSRVLR